MSDAPIPGGPGDMDEEALKRFLKETFGDALPEGALDGLDLSALAQQANLPQDPAQLRAAAAQMQSMFAAQGDSPVNWDMAEDIARRTAAGQTGIPGMPEPTGTPGDPGPSDSSVSSGRPTMSSVPKRTPASNVVRIARTVMLSEFPLRASRRT